MGLTWQRLAVALAVGGSVILSACGVAENDNDAGTTAPVRIACNGGTPWTEAGGHVGENIIAEGPVAGAAYVSDVQGQPTFLNIGKDYPSPDRLTAVIWGQNRHRFPSPPENIYAGEDVCVSGEVELYEGVPEIEITSPSDIWFAGDDPTPGS